MHRRARLLAVGESLAFNKDLQKVKGQLTMTRAKFESVKAEMKSAATKADIALFDLNTAMQEARNIYGALQRERVTSSKLQATTMEYNSLVVQNLRNQLKDTRKVANSYNSANTKLKLLRQKDKAAKNSDRSSWPLSKQTAAVQGLVARMEMDTVLALEVGDELRDEVKELQAENVRLMANLEMTTAKLKAAVDLCANPDNATNWVDRLGKRGQKYDVFIVEMGIQLMSSELSAPQAVYALTVFMMKTYPNLEPGIDYRIPGESQFKEWAEAIYEVPTPFSIPLPSPLQCLFGYRRSPSFSFQITCEVNRSRLQEAAIIFYKYDDSPRNGYNYHGMNCEAVFVNDDGTRRQEHVPIGLEMLPNGGHNLQAEAAVDVLGENIVKVAATMADNAAKDVGDKIFVAKDIAVDLMKAGDENLTEEQLEVMATNFVDTCITHGGDLASKKHFAAISDALNAVIITFNAAAMIQHAAARHLIRRNLKARQPRKAQRLMCLLLSGKLSRAAVHTPMKLVIKVGDDGTHTRHWELTTAPPNIWSLMCSMSNLISHQGKHALYYLNEHKAFRLFWAKWEIENEVHGDTEVADLPSFANNRFGIRQELAFKLCVTWVAAMTYVSEVRVNDPAYDANLLLQHTFELNDIIYRSFVISAAVLHGSICQLMRYCWHTEDFCDPWQRDKTIEVYEKYALKLPLLTDEVLHGALKELKEVSGEEKGRALDDFWKQDPKGREIVFAQARNPEYRPCVEMFLHEAALPTSADIASRKRTCPDVGCLKTAPIHNMKTENMFAHSSYAEQSTRAEHHRLRGLSLSKASGTFALQGKMRSNRKKRFRAMAKRSKVMLSDWVENHKDDDSFLGLFNEKKISIQRRHEIMLKAMSGRRDNVRHPRNCTCMCMCMFCSPTLTAHVFPPPPEKERHRRQAKPECPRAGSSRCAQPAIEIGQQRQAHSVASKKSEGAFEAATAAENKNRAGNGIVPVKGERDRRT